MSTQIKPYCQACNICKTPDQFNLTARRKTYRYICKVCEIDKQKEEANILYETTKKKLEDQSEQQHKLAGTPDREKDYLVFHCPYKECNILNIVYSNEIHCGIFRCGYDKLKKQQIPQHTSKRECEQLRNNPNVIGCVRPYQLNTLTPMICDYI
jgi:hypothetical protein